MNGYITVQEAALKWGISPRQVQILCKSNRIDGATRMSVFGSFRKTQKSLQTIKGRQRTAMTNLTELQNLVDRFHANIDFYKDARNAYNEHSCRIEYIDPLLKLLGWDVANEKGLAPQYREVIAENYSTRTDRPDYTITLRGVPKFFVEAKKPAVDITRVAAPAIQTRKYGWNAKHRLAVLTNFEYLAIYDTCHIAHEDDGCAVARYRLYHYTEYVEKS